MKKKKRTNVAMVSELKAGLSRYLARVKRGEELLVTDRGQVIAKLVPVRPSGGGDEWSRVRDLERQGQIIVRGEGKVTDAYRRLQIPDLPPNSVVRALLEDRDESW